MFFNRYKTVKSKILKFFLLILIVGAAILYYLYQLQPYQIMTGETMNTYYRIAIRGGHKNTLLHNAIKDELLQINSEMSVFDNMSDISQFNRNTEEEWIEIPENLSFVLKGSYQIYKLTNGYFDPSVGPLAEIWGFGINKIHKIPSKEEIKETKQSVGLNQITFSKDFRKAKKNSLNISLNLSAIAKGYAVDRIAKLLEDQGYKNFIVEIGGEIRAKGGRSNKEHGWNIAIARPDSETVQNYAYAVRLSDMSVATSGDYRNYFNVDGKRYSHTIDPKTGYPVEHNLASVTVFDKECMRADALATAIMSMGENRGLDFANRNRIPVVLFIHSDDGFQILMSNEGKNLLQQISLKTEAKEQDK